MSVRPDDARGAEKASRSEPAPDRTRSDASLATEDTQWPTPFSHQSSAWLGKFSDSRNRLAPLSSMAAPKGGGGSAALCLPSASPLSDARCRSHETRLCAPSGWHFFTPAPTTETPSIAESLAIRCFFNRSKIGVEYVLRGWTDA